MEESNNKYAIVAITIMVSVAFISMASCTAYLKGHKTECTTELKIKE